MVVGHARPPRGPLAPGFADVRLDPAADRYAVFLLLMCPLARAHQSGFHLPPANSPPPPPPRGLVSGDLLVCVKVVDFTGEVFRDPGDV